MMHNWVELYQLGRERASETHRRIAVPHLTGGSLGSPDHRDGKAGRASHEHLVQTQEVIFHRMELVRDQEKPQIVPFDPAEHHRETAAGPQAPSVAQLVEQYSRWREKQLQLIAKAPPQLWAKAADHPEYDRYGFEILVRHTLLHDGFHMSRIEELGFMKKELLQPM
jgi:hypothetical protein